MGLASCALPTALKGPKQHRSEHSVVHWSHRGGTEVLCRQCLWTFPITGSEAPGHSSCYWALSCQMSASSSLQPSGSTHLPSILWIECTWSQAVSLYCNGCILPLSHWHTPKQHPGLDLDLVMFLIQACRAHCRRSFASLSCSSVRWEMRHRSATADDETCQAEVEAGFSRKMASLIFRRRLGCLQRPSCSRRHLAYSSHAVPSSPRSLPGAGDAAKLPQ